MPHAPHRHGLPCPQHINFNKVGQGTECLKPLALVLLATSTRAFVVHDSKVGACAQHTVIAPQPHRAFFERNIKSVVAGAG